MSDVALVGNQIRYEQKSYWRNPRAAFFTFAFPLVFFFILVSARRRPDRQGRPRDVLHNGTRRVKLAQYYTPSILAYAVMSACFLAVAMTLVRQREAGILKRMRGTPLPAWALHRRRHRQRGHRRGAAVGVCVRVLGRWSTASYFPLGHLLPLIVTIVLAALAFCALGVAVSSLIPNIDSGPAIINLPYFVLVFISGTYFPISGTMAKIAAYLPLRPFIVAMYKVFDPTEHRQRAGRRTSSAVLAIWGVGSTVFAARHFRWTPRRG